MVSNSFGKEQKKDRRCTLSKVREFTLNDRGTLKRTIKDGGLLGLISFLIFNFSSYFSHSTYHDALGI